ncbi:uncharacterized protein B0T15DRAFT_144488 [Chaetomium strumarium]|uniref:Uncharacterized protein n=1 Tax=Chaetomium strumarium TaxID=1170767 RepID=A0AAJ0GUY4_9PEZI|nr:hypothetical protein B0T15DRAFT_144488 [Chaetomium strumarium]
MDSKQHFASLMEDYSSRPGTASLRSLSPFRSGRRSSWARSGDGGSTCVGPSQAGPELDLNQDQGVLSCVTKETSQEDCARHRFIVWAAVKRNSSVRMTAQERLECPLLRCTQRFPDHEAMLKHLAGCRYLAFGEYWCYDHMRVERFDDLKCKRCLGHPSKRRKMLYMAKNFFHSLGHKSKKAQTGMADDESILQPPPSYDSLNIPSLDGRASELPSTEILEIDSMEVHLFEPTPVPTPVPASVPAPSDVIDPQALLMPVMPALPTVPELDSTTPSKNAFMQWQPAPTVTQSSFPSMAPGDGLVRFPAVKPALQVTTAGLQGRRQSPRPVARPAPAGPRGKGLSPSSSVRSTASTDSDASIASKGSSMISPVSNWSGAWSMGSGLNTSMTSPVDGIVADDMFADALNSHSNDACPDFLHDFFSELPADMPILDNACDMASDALLGFDAPLPTNLSYTPDIILTDVVAESVGIQAPESEPEPEPEREVEQTNVCCSETKALVSSAWDALQEHMVSSKMKIQDDKENQLANQLGSMSVRTVAVTGLRTLRALINGQRPSSASDALCLVHLVYTFSLVLHEQGTLDRFTPLFLQSLAYVDGLPSIERDFYRQLVVSIWQPPGLNHAQINNRQALVSYSTLGLNPDPKGKSPEVAERRVAEGSDSLLMAARDFLDELEISILMSQEPLPLDVQVSELHMTHLKDSSPVASANGALLAMVRTVLEALSQGFDDAGLNNRLRRIYQKLANGSICSVRRIELEMLHAGRSCLPVTTCFGRFVHMVRRSCDKLYEQHDVGPSRRNVYHGHCISLIEHLIPGCDDSGGKAADAFPLNDIDAFFNDLTSEKGDTTVACINMQPPGIQMLEYDANQTELPTPTATSSGSRSPSGTQAGSPPAGQTQQPAPVEPTEQQQAGQKVEANSCCEICGYRPKGDPQWFKGSMAKHKKLQHSTEPPKIYKCPYPGCTSQYKNRPDNLRQHQIEKNHFVQGEEITPRRPSKRKKVADGE